MESNVRKAGISMIALVITIIVLIVLTSAVVITGIGAPKQAQLAVFYNNIDTVQDLVSLTMGDNMITATLEGKEDNYKWVNIVEGCNTENWSTSGVVTFGPIVTGLDKNVARISPTLLKKTSLSAVEIGKYYVDNNGVVYYEGFVYEGQTLYTKETITSNNNTPEVVTNPMDGSFNADKGVNSPKLLDGMVGIYWNNGVEVYSHVSGENADYTRTNANENFDYDQWYDYIDTTNNANTSRWANAKTSDGSYWVWIPRYAYKIDGVIHTSNAQPILIEFLENKETTKTGVNIGTYTLLENVMQNYVVHPAFTVEGTELSGIWVSKYEMSMETNGSSTVTSNASKGNKNVVENVEIKAVSKPGVNAWRYIEIGNMFTNGLNYNRVLESHLMKNIEWGAVAYLTESKYGRNGTEISQNAVGYTTGAGGLLTTTTGNMSGVYDMNGGAWEYVAAYVSGTTNANGQQLIEGAGKYKEVYDVGTTTDYGKIGGKINFGDAIYETSSSCAISSTNSTIYSSWYGDFSVYVSETYPFIGRGGGCRNSGSINGAFYFGSWLWGAPVENYSWRVVLWGSLN